MLGIGQLHHQSATAPSCNTYTVNAIAAHRSHELWSHTHIAESQTKCLGLVCSVAPCLALQNLKWLVVAVQLCPVHDGQAHCPAENKVT